MNDKSLGMCGQEWDLQTHIYIHIPVMHNVLNMYMQLSMHKNVRLHIYCVYTDAIMYPN